LIIGINNQNEQMNIKEDFLHFIWKHKLIQLHQLRTTDNQAVQLIHCGTHNKNGGPDFFNAKLTIAGQLWVGNVEIHIRSTDWYAHGHHKDKVYDNVILHVVWEHDGDIFSLFNRKIPTLVLADYTNFYLIDNYQKLYLKKPAFIACETDLSEVDPFVWNNWLEYLFIERMEEKAVFIQTLLKKYANDWEAVFFCLLAKNFGLHVNGDAFLTLAESIPYGILRKEYNHPQHIESLLFGQANLLEEELFDEYYTKLRDQYNYLKNKYKLTGIPVPLQFFRLRPANFPTIRLAQLAAFFTQRKYIFSTVIVTNTIEELHRLFEVSISDYWNTHYTFQTPTKNTKRRLSNRFINLLIINTIIPIKFVYQNQLGKENFEDLLSLINGIKPESNVQIDQFIKIGVKVESAFASQSLLQLKNRYCIQKKCLACSVGNYLIQSVG